MKKCIVLSKLVIAFLLAPSQDASAQNPDSEPGFPIVFESDKPEANYDFARNWKYKPHITRLSNGQLRCSVCPVEAQPYIGKNGNVKKKNLAAYYRVIDTAHIFQTMASETDIPGFENPSFVKGFRTDETRFSLNNSIGKDASFSWQVNGNLVNASLVLPNAAGGTEQFQAVSGGMNLGLKAWVGGIMEGTFEFRFRSVSNPELTYTWKGVLRCPIEE